jgi:hypothetical protein
MKRSVSSLMLTLFLVACGGNGSGDPLSEGTQDRSRGGQRLNSDAIERTDRFSFDARIVDGSLVEQGALNISDGLKNVPQKTYLISNLDGLKRFNGIPHDNQQGSFDDLATHTYFLVSASACPAYSELAGIEYGHDQITIKINRFKPKENIACIAAITTSFHVFRGEKLHAPEIPFESLEHQAHSYIDDERLAVISNKSAWAALWAEHHRGQSPTPALPEIDFTESMVVAVYIGTRPNGCYSVGIDRIYRSGDTIVVEYTEQIPSAENICTMALVSPSHLVVIPKTPYPFEFRRSVRGR